MQTSRSGNRVQGPGIQTSSRNVQSADIGLLTGNGKKLSSSQAQLDQATGLTVG